MITRRAALRSLFVAPAIIRTPGLLMPIKPLVRFGYDYYVPTFSLGGLPGHNILMSSAASLNWIQVEMQKKILEIMGIPPGIYEKAFKTSVDISEVRLFETKLGDVEKLRQEVLARAEDNE